MPGNNENFLFSDSGAAPPASPLLMLEQPGIGLQPQAPVEDRFVPPDPSGIALQPSAVSPAQARWDAMGGLEKFGTVLSEFGAGMQGRESPLNRRIALRRQEKILRLQEIKAFSEITKDTLDNADRLTGSGKTQYIKMKAAQLDEVSPGSGAMLTTLTDDPDYGKMVMKYAEKSELVRTALEVGGIRGARDLIKAKPELVRAQIEALAFPDIRKKLMGLGNAAKELSTPEEHAQIMEDGFISPAEAARLSENAKGHAKYKVLALTDSEFNLASKNEEATFALSGFATSKMAQELLKEGGKPRSDIAQLKADLKADRITQKEYDAKFKKLTAESSTNVYGTGIHAAVDEEGNPVFVQSSGKPGVEPRIVPGVRPPRQAGTYKLPDGSTISHPQLIAQYRLENKLMDDLDLQILSKTDPGRAAREREKIDNAKPFPDWTREKFGIDVTGASRSPGKPAQPGASPGAQPSGEVQARRTLKGKSYVKRNGQWYEE